jgi:hypothetical protein
MIEYRVNHILILQKDILKLNYIPSYNTNYRIFVPPTPSLVSVVLKGRIKKGNPKEALYPSHNSGQKLVAIRRLGVRNVSFCIPELICKDIYSLIEIFVIAHPNF